MTTEPVEWRFDAANSRLIRFSIYGWTGLLGGGILLALGLVLFAAVGAALAGEYVLFGLVILLLLIGGPFSLLYLWPAVRSGSFSPISKFVLDLAADPEESLAERYSRTFSWRWFGSSIILHVIGIPALLTVAPRVLYGYVAAGFGILVLLSGFQTWGRIDPREPSFEYRSSDIPLQGVKRVRRYRVGPVFVGWLSYHAGVKTITTPSFVVLTPAAATALETALDGVEGPPPEPAARRPLPKLVAVGIGLLIIGFAGWLWLFADIATGSSAIISVLLGLVGVFFVWVGLFYT